jgi:Flp pilus assembly protein TadD
MIVDVLEAADVIERDPRWNRDDVESLRTRVLTRIDRKAEAAAMANLAKVFTWSGKIEEGTRAAREAVALNPNDAVALRTLADLLLRQGDAAAAVIALRRALRSHPEAPELRDELAGALLRKGRPGKALAEYEHVLRLRPDSPIALNNVAWLLATSADAALRDPARALELALRAQERSEEADPNVLDTLAAAHAEQGDFVKARKIAAEAIASARERGELENAQAIAERLDRYRRGEPYRD